METNNVITLEKPLSEADLNHWQAAIAKVVATEPTPESLPVVVNIQRSDNIRAAMSHRDITVQMLIERSGLSPDRVARAMAGLPVHPSTLIGIAEVLGVSRVDLVLMPTRKLNRQMQWQRWKMRARTLRRGGLKK